jgi:hypoxanthine phosphoribosyltransferase
MRPIELPPICERVELDSVTIQRRVRELGEQLTEDFGDTDLRLVTVLRGGLFFLADLCRTIDADVKLDFLAVAPYAHGQGGAVRVTKDLDDSVKGSTIIIVEDVVDTGLTLNYILSFLRAHEPERCVVCALMDKPARRIAPIDIAYCGFEMSDRFLVGYGLDVAGRYRHLPYVASVNPEVVYG